MVDIDWNCKKKPCKNKKSFDALKGGWTRIGIAKKSAKIRGLMH